MNSQPGILGPVPKHARYMFLSYEGNANEVSEALDVLADVVDGEKVVAGLGPSLVKTAGKSVPGLRLFPAMSGAGFDVPSTPFSLWCWLRGDDRGELHHYSRHIEQMLSLDFQLNDVLDAFMYSDSRDLTGYIDGTENPEGDEAIAAAIVQGQGEGMDGSSFVAVQQWRHDFACFDSMSQEEQDNAIGRHKSNNEEFDAPPSAHVKRTAQESFSPEAFVLRRSMPWVESSESGLNFVAFGKSLDAFEAQLRRMVGEEDGIADALFSFTRPLTGGYYWCPPMKEGKLDLSWLS